MILQHPNSSGLLHAVSTPCTKPEHRGRLETSGRDRACSAELDAGGFENSLAHAASIASRWLTSTASSRNQPQLRLIDCEKARRAMRDGAAVDDAGQAT